MPDWKKTGKKAGKAWATGGASLAYDKLKQRRESQNGEGDEPEQTNRTNPVANDAEATVATQAPEVASAETPEQSAVAEEPVDEEAGAEANVLPTADADTVLTDRWDSRGGRAGSRF